MGTISRRKKKGVVILVVGLVLCVSCALLEGVTIINMPNVDNTGFGGSYSLGVTMKEIYKTKGECIHYRSNKISSEVQDLIKPDYSTFYDSISIRSNEYSISPVTYLKFIFSVINSHFTVNNVDDITSIDITTVPHTSKLDITGEVKESLTNGKVKFSIGDTVLFNTDEDKNILNYVDKGVKTFHIVYDNRDSNISNYTLVSVED